MATKAKTESVVKTMQRTNKLSLAPFAGKFWMETAFDAAEITARLPRIFMDADIDLVATTATFLATMQKDDLTEDDDRAWRTLTSPIGMILAPRMVDLGLSEKEMMLYVLRVAMIFAEAVQSNHDPKRPRRA